MSDDGGRMKFFRPRAARVFRFILHPSSFALFLLLAACNNDPHPPALEKTRPDGSPWQVRYTPLPDDPRSLDPQFSYDTVGHSVIALLYESLLQYHPFKVDPYELTPCLADTMPERKRLGNGRESYLIHLKSGLFFHDDPCFEATQGIGREVVAEDVAYAFKRIADPKVECPVFSTLEDYVEGLHEAYADAKRNGFFDYQKPLPGVEVVDKYTVRITLAKPYPQILYWLAMPFTAPVPHEAVDYYDGIPHEGKVREQFKFHPVGTGPFRLVEWSRNRLIRLERFDRYTATQFPAEGWPASDDARFKPLAGARIPFLDEIQMRIIRESIPAWLLFKQGYLDASGISKDVFNTVLDAGRDLTPEFKRRGVALHKDPEPATFYLIFNMEDPVFGKNKKLRQAISAAYDEDFSNEVFSNGIELNAQELLPPGVFGFQPGLKNPYKQHDLEFAKKLMIEAGWPGGRDAKTGEQLKITLDVAADDATTRQLAEFQKGQIEQLGIRVAVQENLWERQQEKVINGQFQLVAFGWDADYPDPENFFFLFYSKNAPPAGSNSCRYSNPEFDRIYEKMCTMENTPERLALIHRLTEILNEDCPFVLLSHSVSFALTQPWAQRVSSNPLLAGGAKYVSVDTALRTEKRAEWNRPVRWPLVAALFVFAAGLAYGIRWSIRRNV
jgi:ABC-type transport system substrate-binding protein